MHQYIYRNDFVVSKSYFVSFKGKEVLEITTDQKTQYSFVVKHVS
jgi:hypothetical protein